jgi:limonene-1,2-epoxide hydrolase
MEDPEQKVNFNRARVESLVHRHVAAWEARDASAISATLHPQAEFVLPTGRWQGQPDIQAALSERLAGWHALRVHIRRLLIDVEQQAAAVEWIGRHARPGESGCREIRGGTVLDFNSDGLVWRWRTYFDPVRRRLLQDFEAPLPDEAWSPGSNPGPPPTRAVIQQIIDTYAQAWASHSVTQLGAVIHDEICLQPPWDYMTGRAAFELGAQVYFDNYNDTLVTPQRLILDSTQPYFGVCQQTFACTNPDTGQRGEDHDFAFFEVAQGKLRYWRTYFDTSRSVQKIEKTVGFLPQ